MISAILCKNNHDKGLQIVHTVIQHHIMNYCFKDQIIFVQEYFKSFSKEKNQLAKEQYREEKKWSTFAKRIWSS